MSGKWKDLIRKVLTPEQREAAEKEAQAEAARIDAEEKTTAADKSV